jgi:hypothetical protein
MPYKTSYKYILLSDFLEKKTSVFSKFYVKMYEKPDIYGAIFVYSGRLGGVPILTPGSLALLKREVEASATAFASSFLLVTQGVE